MGQYLGVEGIVSSSWFIITQEGNVEDNTIVLLVEAWGLRVGVPAKSESDRLMSVESHRAQRGNGMSSFLNVAMQRRGQ